MLGMAGFDCVFALQHSYSRDRCDTIFRIRFWTQHHPSPLLLLRKGLAFLVYPTIKQTALAQVSQQEHCARAVCMKKKNIFQLSEKNRTSTAKYAHCWRDSAREREQTPYPAPPAKSKFRPGHHMLAGFDAAAPGPDGREYLPFLPAVPLPH